MRRCENHKCWTLKPNSESNVFEFNLFMQWLSQDKKSTCKQEHIDFMLPIEQCIFLARAHAFSFAFEVRQHMRSVFTNLFQIFFPLLFYSSTWEISFSFHVFVCVSTVCFGLFSLAYMDMCKFLCSSMCSHHRIYHFVFVILNWMTKSVNQTACSHIYT